MCSNRPSVTDEYRALVDKVDAFTRAVATRRADDLRCAAGCSSCCHAWLSVNRVEAEVLRRALAALAPALREEVRARGMRELAREARGEGTARWALLDEQGRCSVYDSRPLVCRTQGHALRYPHGFIPEAAVTRKTTNGDVTWCPLNYHAAEPRGEDVLDAERVDQILALVDVRAGERHALVDARSPSRLALSSLAAEADVLHDRTAPHDDPANASARRR